MTPDFKIVVLGASGMLGHKMFLTLRGQFPGVRGWARTLPEKAASIPGLGDLQTGHDFEDIHSLENDLRQLRPEVIINCAGIVKQRAEAQAAIPSIVINSLLPHKLAEVAAQWGGRLIHFSTDCVFSGKRGSYSETDPSDAGDLYGKTKYLGEVATLNSITLRTSMIGRELRVNPHGLLGWFISQNHGKVRGFTRAIYSGLTTNHLTDVVSGLIGGHPGLSGLYQVVSRPISKYDLLCLIRDIFKLDIEIEPVDGEVCDRSMKGDLFHEATGYVCPEWPLLIQQLADDPTPYGTI